MKNHSEINMQIRAETQMAQMNIETDLNVQMDGIFSRNYEPDLLNTDIEKDHTTITLSRDGIFHLLPEKLFFEENMLRPKGKRYFEFNEKYKELTQKKKEILAFFKPFDTEFFKLNLELEKKQNELAEIGNEIFQKLFIEEIELIINTQANNIFRPEHQNSKPEPDKNIDALKKLLPFVSQIRGNFPLIIDLLKNILSVDKIEIKEIKPLKKRFIIHKEKMNKEEYMNMSKALIPFFDFLQKWFIPVELTCDFQIKDYQQRFILGEELILDYNTNL